MTNYFNLDVMIVNFGDHNRDVIFPNNSYPADFNGIDNDTNMPRLSWHSSGLPPCTVIGVNADMTNLLNDWGVQNNIPTNFFDGI